MRLRGIFIRMQEPSDEYEKIERLRRAMYSRSLSPKFKDRPRRPLESGKSQVGEDWEREEPEVPSSLIAPRNIGAGRSAMRWFLIATVAFFVGAVGFFAYYFTIGGGASFASSPGDIGISISGPLHVAGGESAELQVAISNRNRAALELADLIVTYPPGTRSPSDLKSDVPSQRIPLGTIESGGMRQVPIRAVFAGAEGQRATVKVELEYRLAGSSAIFVASSDYEIVFSSSPLSISLEGNSETVSGQPILLTINVTSNAAVPVKDVLLSIGYPFGFVFSSADPNPARAGVWELGDITPGRTVRVAVRGTLTGESGDERVFRATIGTRKTQNSPGIDTPLSDNSYRVLVSQPFLGLGISVNKKGGAGVIVAPGGDVDVTIAWQNNLSTAITDAVIVARLSGVQIDGETVRVAEGFYRSSDSAVLWDKTTTAGALSNLPSGAKGEVTFSFKMPPSEVLAMLKNPNLTITVNAAGKRLSESGVPENLQSAKAQTIKVASDLQVYAQGLYYGNPFGSVGPMPPKSGMETTYAVVFAVTNTTNKIKDAKLTATLPSYVRWLGMYTPSSSENVTFNKDNGTISWSVGDIESGAGVSAPLRQVAIAIGFTPSTSQIGESPVLMQDITLTGTDTSTNAPVTRTTKDITTNIQGDKGFKSADSTVVR